MCLIAAKYFDGVGWIGAKNRDRVYKASITIKQSFQNDIERMYIYDNKTKYTEGLNEFGTCIICTTQYYALPRTNSEVSNIQDQHTSLGGTAKIVRKALLESNINNSVKIMSTSNIKGNVFVFNKSKLFVIEGYNKDKIDDSTYVSEVREIDHTKQPFIARSNHNLWLTGNDPETKYDKKGLKSSVRRQKVVEKALAKVTSDNFLSALSDTSAADPYMNVLRVTDKEGDHHLHTTGQLLLVPATLTLSYKPIWGKVDFNFEKINADNSKTFFEVISNKKMLTVKESKSFKNWYFAK